MPKRLEDLITKEELEKIITMYKNGVSLRQIEKETHHGRPNISRMLQRLNVKFENDGHENHPTQYKFDDSFFERIDNGLKAYWLGFMYADGSIIHEDGRQDRLKLVLAQEDEEILLHFKNDLKSEYPIRYDTSKNQKNSNHQIQVICCYTSQKACDDLQNLGCTYNKSLTLEFPTEEQVPKQFIYDFIRGYFDGDGSISECNNNYTLSFVGTENFIKTLSTYFTGGSVLQDKRKINSWYYNLGGNLQVLKAYHLLYDNADRFMQRKYNKFQVLSEKYNES